MKWYKKIYIGEKIIVKYPKLLARIKSKKLAKAYMITLPSNKNNLLDIVPYSQLLLKKLNTKNMYVVGLAGDKEDAYEVVRRIIYDVYSSTGDFKVEKYLKEK